MSDWKQITARIRRARTSKDPGAQLSNLFQKTRDAMVAYELARYFETSGQNGDAAQWYATAAQRFRRADWKTKAQEAAARLGGGSPVTDMPGAEAAVDPDTQGVLPLRSDEPQTIEASPAAVALPPEPGVPFMQNAESFEVITASLGAASEAPAVAAAEALPARKRRHRGRRGGRNRRKGDRTPATAAATEVRHAPGSETANEGTPMAAAASAAAAEPVPPRVVDSRAIPRLPVEETSDSGGPALKGRFGDPGLSSRLSLLEMQFRRLLMCPPAKLQDASHAPAGPGVFVLTDDDMTTYYHVEACQTLRIAIANLARGSSSRRGAGEPIKKQLAGHLGIPEARAGKYLTDHCVVRWLQLDEGADHFAHFAIAVLRPVLVE